VPYRDLTIAEFADAVGERTSAPASGSATAVAAALAAALVELTARFSDDTRARDEAVRLRARLLALADEDAAAYTEFMATRSEEARSRTVDVPAELAEAAAAVARLGERLEREGNPRLVGDAAAAVELARAAVRVGARLVELNLDGREDRRGARTRELAEARNGFLDGRSTPS
jgi:formiminotetrahydrofolate cyclodeaminase